MNNTGPSSGSIRKNHEATATMANSQQQQQQQQPGLTWQPPSCSLALHQSVSDDIFAS
ncbi:hypothetical protein PCANC_03914 [Puccinia coronata f. sp. avenae]|uniref:Uncharacterized protein n=1 Tax=Puccinia coronata f. sp. avenae TaxID=200324 RepID=A0A2N5W178_9BASI|nr:hypothetical protein PCANC_18658 [Puccinia coronata f. sp. avenae]PLW56011.1 hypothetical protein PCANC_03914 [Puccinia coronata f. sp. avenae]